MYKNINTIVLHLLLLLRNTPSTVLIRKTAGLSVLARQLTGTKEQAAQRGYKYVSLVRLASPFIGPKTWVLEKSLQQHSPRFSFPHVASLISLDLTPSLLGDC